MIGFLRFIGVMNAVVWLGTAIFFTFGAEPACFSVDMRSALGVPAASYYPGAIAGVLMTRYYDLALGCAVIALLHLLVEWLYQGKPGRKFSFYLLVGIFVLTLINSHAIHPAMVRFNKRQFTAPQPTDRQSAGKDFYLLHITSRVFNFLIVGGLCIYTWRVVNPSDTLRFRPVQFRS